jgi:hypothetical protein
MARNEESNHEEEMGLYGTIEAWSNKLGISEQTLEKRLKHVIGISARLPNGEIVNRGCYAEDDVYRVCADLLEGDDC